MPAFRVTNVSKREVDAPGRRATLTLATEEGPEVELSLGTDILPRVAAELEMLAASATQQIYGKPKPFEDGARYLQKWLVDEVFVFPDLRSEKIAVLLHNSRSYRVEWQLQSLELAERLARMLDEAVATARKRVAYRH